MRKGDVEGKARISLFQGSLTQSTQRYLERTSWLISWEKKNQWQSSWSATTVRCYSWGVKILDIPIFSWHKERKSHKIHRKYCPKWGRLLWYLVCNSRLLKAYRNVSYHKAKIAGLKFSSVPKQLVSPFPSVAMDFPQNYIYGLTPRIKSENL